MRDYLSIKNVNINYFRSIEKIFINEIDKINVLIGSNESGKSNILKALKWFSTDDPLSKIDEPKLVGIEKNDEIVNICFDINNPSKFNKELNQKITNDDDFKKYFNGIDVEILEIKYLNVCKNNNGKKVFQFYDQNGELNTIIKYNTIKFRFNYISKQISNLNFNQLIKKCIKAILEKEEIELNDKNITDFYNQPQINEISELLKSEYLNLINKSYQNEEVVNNFEKLKSVIINNDFIVKFPIENIEINIQEKVIKWTKKEFVKSVIKSFYFSKIEEPIKLFSTKNIINKYIELPNFIYYSGNIELFKKVRKNKNWEETIQSNKNDLYYKIFRLIDFDISSLNSKDTGEIVHDLHNQLNILTKKIRIQWKQKKLKLIPIFTGSELLLTIVDVNNKGEELIHTLPEERSDGLKWFLGYYITLEYIKKFNSNNILLLDDPAVFLHPKGQIDFLNQLEKISVSNQIFYTTHLISLFSEYNLERIYLIENNDSKTIISKPWNNNQKDIIEPIRRALGLDIILFIDKQKIFFVEGISDKFIFEAIFKICFSKNDWYICPLKGGDGINKNKIILDVKVISFLKSYVEKKELYLILDGDKKEKFDNEELKDSTAFIGEKSQELEDLIPKDYYIQCIKEVYYPIFLIDQEKIYKVNEICKQLLSKEITKGFKKEIEKVFKKEKLGGFDATLISKYIKNDLLNNKNIYDEFFEIIYNKFIKPILKK